MNAVDIFAGAGGWSHAPATCRRIAAGIVRFVLQGKPFIVTCNHGKEGFRGQGIDEPMKTVTASHDANGLVLPTLIQTGYGERRGQAPRSLDLQAPLGTVVAGGAKHGLVAAFLQQNFTGMVGKPLRVPVPTITARDHHSLVAASLTTLRGTAERHLHGDDAAAPPRRQPKVRAPIVATPLVRKIVRLAFEKARASGDKFVRAFHLEAAMRETFRVKTGGRA